MNHRPHRGSGSAYDIAVCQQPRECSDGFCYCARGGVKERVCRQCIGCPIDLIRRVVREIGIVLRSWPKAIEPVRANLVIASQRVGPESVAGCEGYDFDGSINQQLVGPTKTKGKYR